LEFVMTWKLDSRYIGYPPIEAALPTLAVAQSQGISAANWPPVTPGLIVPAEDPVWGGGEFLFAKASANIPLRAMCALTAVWNATNRNFDWNVSGVPNTAILGKMVAIAMADTGGSAVNALTTGQFGWFMISGHSPVNGTVSVAADTAYGITAVGQVGTLAAGKQIVSSRVIGAATQTVTATAVRGDAGGNTIQVSTTDGFFVGCYVSGTGVGAAAIVSGIDRVNNVLTVSVVNSALVTGTVTGTYNNGVIFYNTVHMNRSFAQGAIT
jgi:hypothetical protein